MFSRVAKAVVEKRNLIFLFYIIAILFSVFAARWVKVENNIVNYLAKDSKTRQGITVMEDEFTSFAMADVMVSNISFDHASLIADEIGNVPGVGSVMFEDSEEYYKHSSAFFVVLFSGEDNDEATLNAMRQIRAIVEPYDFSISTSIGVSVAQQLTKDMLAIGILASIVVLIVLTFTSQSYAEIPVLLMTFGAAALLNLGTNFLLGKISFISNSVAVVLQLALAIDYAIILCHRFTQEHAYLPAQEAAVEALGKAIPEISSSSLTTIGGLAALAFMQFGIGKDLASVLIKAILISMFCVFTLMPGLLVMFGDLIKKTKHKSFIPSVSAIGRFSIKTRYIIPPIFAVLLVASFFLSNRCPFLFTMEEIRSPKMTQEQVAQDRITDTFGRKNMVAFIVPSGDYASEKALLTTIGDWPEVLSAVGLSNTEALGGYMLTDSLTPRQFSELVDLDFELAQFLYSAYAVNDEDYGKVVSGVSYYGVPLIDMYQFLYEQVVQGNIPFEGELMDSLYEYNDLLTTAKKQMQGENFSRMILHLSLPAEGQETYAFLERLYEEAGQYYDETKVYAVGDSTNAMDLSSAFSKDNMIISVLSVLFVIIVLTFTFQSAGLSILLISVIQASIWVNFSLPYIRGQGLYFLGFLLVSSIQMGANIDYAIVLTSRYQSLKETMPPEEAVIEALNQGFPTVITSGTILAIAGILIGRLSTDGATSVLGSYIGQGTIISIFLVIFVLPQFLYLGDVIIRRTSFTLKSPPLFEKRSQGKMRLSGRLEGYVKGEIDAYVDGTIDGEIRPAKKNLGSGDDNP